MIKLVLSTPRSGSTFFANNLKKQSDKQCDCLHEWFSMLYESSYVEDLGEIVFSRVTPHNPNRYSLAIKDNQIIRDYSPRKDKQVEYRKWINYLKTTSNDVVLHEHITHLPHEWVSELVSISDKCYFIKRNLKEQLASLAIAHHTGVYICTNNKKYCFGDATNIHEFTLDRFDKSIIDLKILESAKINISVSEYEARIRNIEIVNYEDVQHIPGTLTKKLFPSSYERLCDSDKKSLDELCLQS